MQVRQSNKRTTAHTTRTGTTLIPDKLKSVVSDAIYPLLQDVLRRYRHSEAGTSVFDMMTEEEYALYMRLIDDAIKTVRSNI